MNARTVSEVLECAANYIDAHGLLKGRFAERPYPDDGDWGKCCTRGAIGLCASGNPLGGDEWGLGGEARRTFYDYLCKSRFRFRISSVGVWNDQPSRTKEQVVRHLRIAAKKAKEAGK